MKYCSECGATVRLKAVESDHRNRFICTGCGMTHYQSPNVLVASYVCTRDKILWIERGIPPAKNLWAIPGGFMENDETPAQAASRELKEETGITIAAEQMMLVSVSTILHMAQTHLVFRCHLKQIETAKQTAEAPNHGWFSEQDAPWGSLAFPAIEPQIRQVYSWLASGEYGIRVGVVDESGSHYENYPLAIY